MGQQLNIITPLHRRTQRDYLGRMQNDKVACMRVAKRYDRAYWDGDRAYGYGGYSYDGRWRPVAERIVANYNIGSQASILDVGCGKAHLLHELSLLLPQAQIVGLDCSDYALADALDSVRTRLISYRAQDPLPFGDQQFDLVLSIGCLHNLRLFELKTALSEIQRVGRQGFIQVESYRNEDELFNLQCWALTCESFFDTAEWIWLYRHFGYHGDYEFVYFE